MTSVANQARRRIAVAMSGGVDSSVAAYLVTQSKMHDIIGVHMSNWDFQQEDPDRRLPDCLEQEWKDAQAVAQHLAIDIQHVSFTADYWNQVFQPYCDGLSSGIMPNPDVDCNRYIKFGSLREHIAKRFGKDTFLATGHYARVWDPHSSMATATMTTSATNASGIPECLERCFDEEPDVADLLRNTEEPLLLAAVDKTKDQSYFLCGVQQPSFRNVTFPLGKYLKKPAPNSPLSASVQSPVQTVRSIAEEANLPTASKRESMGICFIGKRTTFGDFVQQYMAPTDTNGNDTTPTSGKLISVDDGSIVGTFDPHNDTKLMYATTGQGAKIPGASQRWFIVTKTSPSEIFVCPGTHHPALYVDTIRIRNMNWLLQDDPHQLTRAKCRIRHLQPLVDCELRWRDGDMEVTFDKPLRGVAAGQIAAFYIGGDGLVCLGGGQIAHCGPTYHEQGKSLVTDELHPSGQNDKSVRSSS